MTRIDLVGQRFGRLVVIEEAEQRQYERRWLCQCDCGTAKVVPQSSLRSGKSRSCGCGQVEGSRRAIRCAAKFPTRRAGQVKAVYLVRDRWVVTIHAPSGDSREGALRNWQEAVKRASDIWTGKRGRLPACRPHFGVWICSPLSFGRFENRDEAVAVAAEARRLMFGEEAA